MRRLMKISSAWLYVLRLFVDMIYWSIIYWYCVFACFIDATKFACLHCLSFRTLRNENLASPLWHEADILLTHSHTHLQLYRCACVLKHLGYLSCPKHLIVYDIIEKIKFRKLQKCRWKATERKNQFYKKWGLHFAKKAGFLNFDWNMTGS